MLRFENVSVNFGEKAVLSDFSFEAREGEHTCILGPSGCGKTTLWRLASGLMQPGSGRVTRFEHARAAFVFQEDRLLPWCSCFENLTAVGVPGERAELFLRGLGLGGEERALPDELSGGMKRRLAIARALGYGGDVFFFDEMLQGLDLKTSGEVLALVAKELSGKTALMITHSPEEALALADRIVIVKGPPVEVVRDCAASGLDGAEELKELLGREL